MAPEWPIRAIEVLLAGGFGYVIKSAWDLWARRSDARTPEASATFRLTHTGQQVDLLARVNESLEQDLAHCRQVLRETEDEHRRSELAWQAHECAWLREKREMQTQLDQMHKQVRTLMDEIEMLQRRWSHMAADDGLQEQ